MYDNNTGNRNRLVNISMAIPRLAVIAISWIISISINRIVIKPMQSLIKAIMPGTNSRRNAVRAAAMVSVPR